MIPETMTAIELRNYDGPDGLAVTQKPVPRPGRGEVLVKIAAASVNPSDLMFIQGRYGFSKPLPVVGGFEGSGTVVAAGEGLRARYLVGRRVACAVQESGDGTWAEYVRTGADFCVPLRREVTLEQGAMLVVNPFTAWALVDLAQRGGHRFVVQTAAASALGQMMIRLGKTRGIEFINVVRRPAQVALLQELGAKHVLDSSDPDFDRQLAQLCHDLGARLAFDAVAGSLTGRVLSAMPRHSTVTVYGGLSEEACRIEPGQLLFGDKQVNGFWLTPWLRRMNLLKLLATADNVQRALSQELRSEVQARYPIAQGIEGVRQYMANMTAGKVLLLGEAG